MKISSSAAENLSILEDQSNSSASRSNNNHRTELGADLRPDLMTYLGIFLTSCSVLLFELVLTRIFAVILWAHLAFMVVGTALFGFGLSGVFLALKPKNLKFSIPALCLSCSLSMFFAYLVILHVPFKMWETSSLANLFYLGVWYIALVVPFFFAGMVIAELLSSYPKASNRLYGFDLIGAASGSLLLLPVLPTLAGEGSLAFAAMLAAISGLLYCRKVQISKLLVSVSVLVAVVFGLLSLNAPSWMPLKLHQAKRNFKTAYENNLILATRWSPMSRVDIAEGGEHKKNRRAIWIDGGTNHSGMIKVTEDIDAMSPLKNRSIGVAYAIMADKNPRVLIIGSSGGHEVLFALTNNAQKVDAVEMDPSIVRFVKDPRFTGFMGNLFQNSRVNLVNDEGRAYMRRQPNDSYDVIQFVNNYTPIAIASGALNLSETFLLTKEAFYEYFSHLTANGVLALHRGASLRVGLAAISALRDMGISNPAAHLAIVYGEWPMHEGLLLKKTPWTEEELGKVNTFMRNITHMGGKTSFIFNPLHSTNDIYSRLFTASAEEQEKHYTSLGINLFPATDDRPFMEHYLQFGKKSLSGEIPYEFRRFDKEKWQGVVPRGDFPYVIILAESAILSLLFVGLPLAIWAKSSYQTKGFLRIIAYYAALGFGFIVVEICLMKKYVLFLGNPIYSLTTILVVLLLAAGLGSLAVDRFDRINTKKAITYLVSILAALLLIETLLAPAIFDYFLGLSFAGRLVVAVLMLFPMGFVMGMPFALGLRLINQAQPDENERRKLIAWAWGINGYATVIGSAATVFVSLFFGFKIALAIAVCSYLLGMLAIRQICK